MKFTYHIIILAAVLFFACEDSSEQSALNNLQGKGGSLARFTISNNHLYAVSREKLKPFNLADPWNPVKQEEVQLGREIETIFPYQNHLFIGSQTGMHIYNIDQPTSPTYVSTYRHVRMCDPVVVQGQYAYVTLRSNVTCGGTVSLLDIIDISDLNNPQEVNSITMRNPYGLGIDGDDLFVCEGEHGIQAFDASHPVNVVKDKTYADHNAIDVILNDGTMIVTGEDGIYQYDYESGDELKFLSEIKLGEDD